MDCHHGRWALVGILLSAMLAACSGSGTSSAPAASVSAVATQAGLASAVPAVSSAPTAAGSPSASETADARTATDVAERYERALASAEWPTAWSLLAPGPFRPDTYEQFVGLGAQANEQGYRRFELFPATRDPAVLEAWVVAPLAADLALRADPSRAYVVPVHHPDVLGASASGETLVVAPLRDGAWRIWRAH